MNLKKNLDICLCFGFIYGIFSFQCNAQERSRVIQNQNGHDTKQ